MAGTIPAGAKGITFSGETFVVPETHDMVQTLFDPNVSKSYAEIVVLILLVANAGVFWLFDNNATRIKIFIGLYVFWRLSYNFGIGYLLHSQSNDHKLVKWARNLSVFDKKNRSALATVAQAEIRSQRGPDYNFTEYPLELNTWFIFRKFVDLILMLDFTSFICLVVASSIENNNQFLHGQATWLVYFRLIVGTILIVFNYWVKVNAHNTIKDFAWYWGDFFFRQINNEELIFDGVFEMVPHPMYSVGYVGYYGFALISKSYTVLIVAIFGHFLQMIFLHYIENPHIDKIYGPSKNEINLIKLLKLKDLKNFDNIKPLVGLYNFNFLRASDAVNLILIGTYAILIPLLANVPNKYLFFLAVAIKFLESFSINILLVLQSHFKFFTRWYLSMDIPVEKSLNNWAIFYNSLINLTYASLFGCNFHQILNHGFDTDDIFFSNWTSLRIFLGLTLIVTQTWINTSIVDLIGYFGWFYGDFFIPRSQRALTHLTKAGVYRYLNNPEQIFGVCGVMGVFVIFPSVENLTFSLLWVANNFIRINFIEKFHMIKIYGEQEVLKDSGVTKTFKKHLIPDVIQRRLTNDSSPGAKEEFLKARKRKNSLTESLDSFIKELKNSKTKLPTQSIIELSQNLDFENSGYQLLVKGLQKAEADGNTAAYLPKYTTIGAPIEVNWIGPEASHSSKDWIGLYKIAQTSISRTKTVISSTGRWVWCSESEGTAVFEGSRLFWEEGVYEFRYHLDGKHDVSYISEPFEIKMVKVPVPLYEEEQEEFCQQLKSQVFDKLLVLESIDTPISSAANKTDNVVEIYNCLGNLVSKSTDIKISSKAFLNDDDEVHGLTIRKLANKLIHFKKVLEELSFTDVSEKKNL